MSSPHFERFSDWPAAGERLPFEPRTPGETLGFDLSSLALWVRDARDREVEPERRVLEAHYGGFVFSQSQPGRGAALRQVRDVSYGANPRPTRIGGCEAREYARGPEPDAGDPDPRMPAVIVWAAGARFFMVASDRLDLEALRRVARSVG